MTVLRTATVSPAGNAVRAPRLTGISESSQRPISISAVAPAATAKFEEFAHLDPLIEAICAQGCKTVYQVMARLQAGQTVPELAHLLQHECNRVLTELDSIMAVYAENGSVCLTGGKQTGEAQSN